MMEAKQVRIFCEGCRQEIEDNSERINKELDDTIFLKQIELNTLIKRINNRNKKLKELIIEVIAQERGIEIIKSYKTKLDKIQSILDQDL